MFSWLFVFVLCPCRDSSDCLVLVLSLLHWLSTGVPGWSAIPGEERAERVLASAISTDWRREWTCKICSESTRVKCVDEVALEALLQ